MIHENSVGFEYLPFNNQQIIHTGNQQGNVGLELYVQTMWIIYTSYIHYTYVHSHPTVAEYTLFSSAHGTVSMLEPEIGQKCHRKFRTINIKPSVFSDYNGM